MNHKPVFFKAVCRKLFLQKYSYAGLYVVPRGGGGGTQIWFRRGCAAEAAKPIPIFKGHFGGKGYLLLRVFSQENDVFVYSTLATKFTKVGGMFIFSSKPYPICIVTY